MSYQQLTQLDRYQIYASRQAGFSLSMIADEIGVHKSTISREIKRNSGQRGYRPHQAQEKSDDRRANAEKSIKFTEEVHDLVVMLLLEKWSPEQISGYLKKEGLADISHERIYQFVWGDKANGGDLYKSLRQSNKKRRKKYGSKASRRGQIKDRVSISKRPKSAENRKRKGDWEGDTVVSSKSKPSVVTLVDRKTRKALILKTSSRSAEIVEKAVVKMLKAHKKDTHTVTLDNGKEFANHKAISKSLETDIYFADPYSSWQRGLNENTNGLLRQYFPKKTDFSKISDAEIFAAQEALNNRPRKSLGFRTPNEAWIESK